MLYLSRLEYWYTDVLYYCKKSFMSKPLAVEQVRRKIISADWCGKTSAYGSRTPGHTAMLARP